MKIMKKLLMVLMSVVMAFGVACSSNNQTGDNQSGGNQTGDNQSGGNQSGDNQSGGNQSGDNQSGGNQSGGNQSGGNQSGGNQSGGNQSGGNQSGDNQSGGAVNTTPTETVTLSEFGKVEGEIHDYKITETNKFLFPKN